MNEDRILAEAMAIDDPDARSVFLEKACADRAGLRARIEHRLRDGANTRTNAGNVPEDANPGTMPPTGLEETAAFAGVRTEETDLAFLEASSRPGALGRLGHYEIEAVIGRGGMGAVLKAFDEKLQRVVALKIMSAALLKNEDARKRFVREARLAASVTSDHIVSIYAVENEGPVPYLVMPLIDGQSLQHEIARSGAMPVAQIARLGMQIADGLAAAHKHKLIHRDIKPANILLESSSGRVKITDFGLARAVDDTSITQSGMVAGSPMYMSPEQAEGKKIDHRSDLFSLGSVLYAMCTGKAAFKANSTVAVLRRVCDAEPRPIREINPNIPPWLEKLIAKLLAKKPADRYQSATEVAAILARHLAELSSAPASDDPRTTAVRPRATAKTTIAPAAKKTPARSSKMPLVIGGVALLAVLGLCVVVSLGGLSFLLIGAPARFQEAPPVAEIAHGKAPIKDDFDKVATPPKKIIEPKVVPSPDKEIVKDDPGKSTPGFKNGIGMEFVLVPKGKAWLGGGGGKPGNIEAEVLLDFYLGKFEVTQEEWVKVMKNNPSLFSRTGALKGKVADIDDEELKRFPVEFVSWDDAQNFLVALNKMEKKPGWAYRLPKEAEWEYACRGGPGKDKEHYGFDFYFEQPMHKLDSNQANFSGNLLTGNGQRTTQKVGSYKPNGLGLCDMHGNVNEWCDDEDKVRPGYRMYRGGCCNDAAFYCQAARGLANPPYSHDTHHGLRVACIPVGKEILRVAANDLTPPAKTYQFAMRQIGQLMPPHRTSTDWPDHAYIPRSGSPSTSASGRRCKS